MPLLEPDPDALRPGTRPDAPAADRVPDDRVEAAPRTPAR